MKSRQSHHWTPIEDLPEDWRLLANRHVSALVAVWQSQAEELRRSSSYEDFLIKMRREWAIETGFIERLYRISEGATKTLIEKGLDAALLLRADVDRSPDEVIAIINDQHDAIEGLYQFVSGDRELGKSYIRELHQVLTAHQSTYEAVDTLGNRVVRDLPRGIWKRLPNNVGDPGEGYYFEFCPPEHVENEMERLLRMHQEHEIQGVPPDLEAAWLHHRFTLIHPFTDGNGRVARCLASLILLKASWFPLVVTRHDGGYIEAIRDADRGDLKPLVNLIGSLQSRAVVQGFSLTEELKKESEAIESILGAVKIKFEKTRYDKDPRKGPVLAIGDALQHIAVIRLKELGENIHETIHDLEPGFRAYAQEASCHELEGKYRHWQVLKASRLLDYFVNFQAYQASVNIVIEMDVKTEIFFSFHGMGRGDTGVLAVAGLFFTRLAPIALSETIIRDIAPLSEDPFLFTYEEAEQEVVARFRPWLEERLIQGLDRWRKLIGA